MPHFSPDKEGGGGEITFECVHFYRDWENKASIRLRAWVNYGFKTSSTFCIRLQGTNFEAKHSLFHRPTHTTQQTESRQDGLIVASWFTLTASNDFVWEALLSEPCPLVQTLRGLCLWETSSVSEGKRRLIWVCLGQGAIFHDRGKNTHTKGL